MHMCAGKSSTMHASQKDQLTSPPLTLSPSGIPLHPMHPSTMGHHHTTQTDSHTFQAL